MLVGYSLHAVNSILCVGNLRGRRHWDDLDGILQQVAFADRTLSIS